MQAALKVITSTCMSHGIEVHSKTGTVTNEYTDFVQYHYHSFCDDALRCMYTCGFVPWRTRKLPCGTLIPETIPLGTFTWSTKSNQHSDMQRQTSGNMYAKKRRRVPTSTEALSYQIRFIESIGIDPDTVRIYTYRKPMGKNTSSSIQSPLTSIISEYRQIYRAMARAEYADEWNTQVPTQRPPCCFGRQT
jgi:hypothetical protein